MHMNNISRIQSTFKRKPRHSILKPRSYTLHNTPTNWLSPLYISDTITDRRSTFVAHASSFQDPSSLSLLLNHLTTLPNLKRATHCMYAYRASGGSVSGQSDGGESGSGDRLTRLLELAGCDDVIVIVSRWYGGVKLGSDRWKRISDVAKQALDRGGFLWPENEANSKPRRGRKK